MASDITSTVHEVGWGIKRMTDLDNISDRIDMHYDMGMFNRSMYLVETHLIVTIMTHGKFEEEPLLDLYYDMER